jgi:hypothetical protein
MTRSRWERWGVVVGPRHRDGIGAIDAGRLMALGFLSGVVVGVVVWSRQQHRHRRDLFSRHPLRRLAALGYLSGQPSATTAHLLRDYIRWEARSVLRRRGKQVLRHVEASLD